MTEPAFIGLSERMWDELWLGGVKFPGVASLSGPGIARKLDVQNPKGAAGAGLKDEGDELGLFDVAILLWEEEQWDEFVRLLPDIQPRRKGGPKTPLEIYHPLARVLGIQNIYIKQIPIPAHDKRRGTVTWTLKAIEWVPAPKPQVKAVGSKGGDKAKGAKGHGPLGELVPYDDPNDDFDVLVKQPNPLGENGGNQGYDFGKNELDVAGSEDAVNGNIPG